MNETIKGVTQEQAEKSIRGVYYFNGSDYLGKIEHEEVKNVTICLIVMDHGLTAVGCASCPVGEEFHPEEERLLAYIHAMNGVIDVLSNDIDPSEWMH